MGPTGQAGRSPGDSPRPRWSAVLRALREARGVTLDGWGERLRVSRKTVQRWETGERAPDPGAEAAILAYCREAGLFRSYDRGPLAGLGLTAELLQDLLAEARWRVSGDPADAALPSGLPPGGLPSGGYPDVMPDKAAWPWPSNLPAPLTSFVGREREIAEVRRLQAGTRLLTLTGAGGCGKTRLALHVAGELLWAFPHGVWLVELAALADPALVDQTVAAALGLQPTGSRPPIEDLKEFLRSRHLLLVLDNCEHLLGACAELVETLLRACPNLAVLATSREPLGIGGETVWRVPPMALPAVAGEWGVGSGEWGRPNPPTPFRTREGGAKIWQRRQDQGAPSPAPLERGLGGEVRPPTPGAPRPTPPPDAVRLFVERARLHRPGFVLTAANVGAVTEVCRRLDGMPLAIELAAARVRVLAVEQIAERLGDRFALLTGGGRTALPRQQTLRAAMAWSHDLLSADERVLLRRLAVFAGGLTLEAAEAVGRPNPPTPFPTREGGALGLAAAPDSGTPLPSSGGGGRPAAGEHGVLDLLTQLVDKSLVNAEEQDGGVRYHLLETIREYAAEQLDAGGEAAEVRNRHLAWCLALAETADGMLRGPRDAEGLAWLEQEHDNLRAALRWSLQREPEMGLRLAGALARFWEARGHVAEGQAWLAQALAREGEAPAAVRARALRGAGVLAELHGEFVAGRALHEQALRLYRQAEDRRGIAEAQASLGTAMYRLGDYEAARAMLEASLALCQELGHKPGIASVQGRLGLIAIRQGDHATAEALVKERLALNRELGDGNGIADALEDLATVAGELGDGERQVALLEESLTLSRELGNTDGVALALGSLGMAIRARGEYDRAAGLLNESLALYRQIHDPRGIARLLAYQGMVALYQRAYPRAEALCRDSLALYRQVGDTWAIGRYLSVLAGAVFGGGRPERAVRLFGAAAALRGRLGAPLPPVIRPDHDRAVAAGRRVLGEQEFAAAWEMGEALSLEEALDYALSGDLPA